MALVCGAGSGVGHAQDLSSFFENTEGTFVSYDLKGDRYVRHNEERARRRFSPFSTFKIPSSLIGLETGVIKDAEFTILWDRKKYPPQERSTDPFVHWNQNQTLRSAMKHSVVWYYRELAGRVGGQQMKRFVSDFNYGNRDTSGGLSSPNLFEAFWLRSTLQISADEQVEFLKKFYKEELSVSSRSTKIVKDIILLEETPAYRLSGKTGSGSPGGKPLSWFVGYLETKSNVYFFAINIEGADYLASREKRVDLTKRILAKLGYLPKP